MTKPLDNLIVTQPFGVNPDYYKQFGLVGHEGIDFKTRNLGIYNGFWGNLMGWQKVYAVSDGIVQVVYDLKDYGTHIYLQDKSGNTYLYAHLKNARCSSGQQVREGDWIGVSDSTGNANGPHLHFGFRPANYDLSNGYKGFVDPMILFNKTFIMQYTAINTDPGLLEQARQIILADSKGQIDCNFSHQQLPPIISPLLWTSDEQIEFLKNFPVSTPFCYLTYQGNDPNHSDARTSTVPGSSVYLTAGFANLTPLQVAFEIMHALQEYIMDKGLPIGMPLDNYNATPDLVQAKVDKCLPFINQLVV